MGLGKTFQMIGICNLFSDNPEQFGSNIGKALQCNIELRTSDWLLKENIEEDELVTYTKIIDLGFDKTEIVLVIYETDGRCKNTDKLDHYEIVIDFKYTECVYETFDLEFHPYGTVHGYLPIMKCGWRSLYDAIIGKSDIYFNHHIEQIKALYEPREFYSKILLNIGITEIVMFTENWYNFEGEFWNIVGTQPIESIHIMVNLAKELDKLQVFDFLSILKDSAYGELSSEFLNCDAYQIIFVDNLHDLLTL